MSWTAVAPVIAAELASIADVGQVHVGDRHIRDHARFRSLFAYPSDVEGERDRCRGWRIARTSISEEWLSDGGAVNYARARERYVLRGVQALAKAPGSERRFQEVVDDVHRHFRALGKAALGGAFMVRAAQSPSIAYADLGDFGCHSADVVLDVEELYTIGTPAIGYPALRVSTAGDRDTYQDVAHQLALYLSSVDGAGQVHEERPWATEPAEVVSHFMVPSDADGAPEGKSTVRAWRIWRGSVEEDRGIGNRVEASSAWKLTCSRSWVDSLDSYDAFQRHVDDVRAVFRDAAGTLGNADNPSLATSSPLQVTELGARGLGTKDMDVLVHFADCEIAVEEVVHA